MITEDYVGFEVAKLLKEKGFDENTHCQYLVSGAHYGEIGEYNITDRSRNPEWFIQAPTLQMAMKWLREEKRCIILPNPTWFTADGCKKWSFSIWADDNLEIDGENPGKRTEYDSYEEAVEDAIKYCLEKILW